MSDRIEFVDSHTEGEPTRVLITGVPELGGGTVGAQLQQLQSQDWFRRTALLEPRGWEAMVGAVLCEPDDPSCSTGVIFFNNTGYLKMCGHGTIGLAATLHFLGRIGLGKHRFESPVGTVEATLLDAHTVEIENVPSYRLHKDLKIQVDGLGTVTGDVAWGGNWFYLVDTPVALELANLRLLHEAAAKIRSTLRANGITGEGGQEIDHIEFFSHDTPDGASKNFVYCPGGAYDRSPCGTGTSAKIACLAADGKLAPGDTWIQQSIIGSQFEARYRIDDNQRIVPKIRGRAFICSHGTLVRQSEDPFLNGIDV